MLRTSAPLIGALDGINMTSRRDELDRMLGQTRWQKVALYSAYIAIVAFVAWFQSPPLGETSEVSGTAVSAFGLPSDRSVPIYISVRLDSGPTVKARIYAFSQFKEGARVRLLKQDALLFGPPRYILSSQDRFTGK